MKRVENQRYKDKTMADKLLYIPNNDAQNHIYLDYCYWLKRLDTQVNEPTKQNLIKSPKLLGQRIRKRYYQLWGLIK